MCYSKYITDLAFTNIPLLLQSRTKSILPLLVDIVLKTASRIDMAARQKGDDIEVTSFAQTIYDRELRWAQG